MIDLISSTLMLIDAIYEPTADAIEHRETLAVTATASETELPFYVAQLSIALTLLDNLETCRSLAEVREHAFRANLAFTVALGSLRQTLGATGPETEH